MRIGITGGGHTWHWMVFDQMMSITRKSWRSRNVTQKRFHVVSNIIDSRKHGSLGIGLTKLRSLRTRLGFHVGLTHGKSSKLQTLKHNSFILIEFDISESFCSLTHTWIFSFQRELLELRCVSVVRRPLDKRRGFCFSPSWRSKLWFWAEKWVWGLSLGINSGGRIRTCDLRVMGELSVFC